jgi:hypothetical protein
MIAPVEEILAQAPTIPLLPIHAVRTFDRFGVIDLEKPIA